MWPFTRHPFNRYDSGKKNCIAFDFSDSKVVKIKDYNPCCKYGNTQRTIFEPCRL